jgi:hypothetical protein
VDLNAKGIFALSSPSSYSALTLNDLASGSLVGGGELPGCGCAIQFGSMGGGGGLLGCGSGIRFGSVGGVGGWADWQLRRQI